MLGTHPVLFRAVVVSAEKKIKVRNVDKITNSIEIYIVAAVINKKKN